MSKNSKKEKIRLGIIFAVVVVILVLIFVVIPRFIVVDDINKFDRLMIGNKVILGNALCNNTWRVEKKEGTRVLLVNEKSLNDPDFFTREYHYTYPPEVLSYIGYGVAGDVYNDLASLNGKYYKSVFGSRVQMMMCDVGSGEPFFIRAKHITWFDLTRENVDEHISDLESGDYEYYPAVWIDTANI